MADPRCEQRPIPESLERFEVTAETNLNEILNYEQSELTDDLPKSIDEFIRDRFSTKLEDPRTGRKVR